jgi:Domain of unknown function (DUF4424)
LLILAAVYLHADDGAASIAEGGLVVMKREARITMAKEVLQISPKKVIVDYDFRNDSDQDITTEVAFPIPDYDHDLDRSGQEGGFDDFQLWIDGAKANYQIEARAFLKDKEYTQLLTSMHIDVASLAHAELGKVSEEIKRLTSEQQKQLIDLELIDWDTAAEPQWRVRKKYYWLQTFPAHKIVHIRHEYTPVRGNENSINYGMGPNPEQYEAKRIKSFCIDGRLHEIMQKIANGDAGGKTANYSYVDFILTTANTWKTPIEDFTLIVERPHSKDRWHAALADYVSFCWDGPVTKIDADHFSAHTVNLIPTKELRIGFFGVWPN